MCIFYVSVKYVDLAISTVGARRFSQRQEMQSFLHTLIYSVEWGPALRGTGRGFRVQFPLASCPKRLRGVQIRIHIFKQERFSQRPTRGVPSISALADVN